MEAERNGVRDDSVDHWYVTYGKDTVGTKAPGKVSLSLSVDGSFENGIDPQ